MGWRSEFGRSTYRYKSNGISIGGGFKNLLALLSKSRESWWTGPCKKFPSLSSISCTVCELSSFHHRRHHNVQDKPGDAFRAHSRSPNRVPFHMLGMLVTFFLVFQLFDFKKCRDLEIRVRGHLRSLKVVPFDRLCTVSYYCPIVTLSVRCLCRTVSEISDFKNAETLKTGLRVREGHWKCHHSIDSLWLPIDVL